MAESDAGAGKPNLKTKAAKISKSVATKVSDLEDTKIARDHAVGAVKTAANETGDLAKAVVRAPLTKDVASYAVIGAAISLPLPVVGPAIGAAIGASLGLFKNMKRAESAAPPPSPDRLEELARLHDLKEKGVITQAEFDAQKRKLLR